MTYEIRHKQKNTILASGFYSAQKASKWIENFNPAIWDDKTMKQEDLVIVEEK